MNPLLFVYPKLNLVFSVVVKMSVDVSLREDLLILMELKLCLLMITLSLSFATELVRLFTNLLILP